jgi:hypothetical protein
MQYTSADLGQYPWKVTNGALRGRYNEDQPQISPDGKWIAYTLNESGRNEVHVVLSRCRRRTGQVSTAVETARCGRRMAGFVLSKWGCGYGDSGENKPGFNGTAQAACSRPVCFRLGYQPCFRSGSWWSVDHGGFNARNLLTKNQRRPELARRA